MRYVELRALEVGRLSLGELDLLHMREVELRRALMPHEIQSFFRLATAKDAYGWPEEQGDQQTASRRLSDDLKARLAWIHDYDLSYFDLEAVHAFDEKLRISLETKSFSTFSGDRRSRLRENFG